MDLVSALPPDEALSCVRAGVSSRWEALVGTGFGGRRMVLGRAAPDGVRLIAPRPGVRNSWSPVLRGRIVTEGTGSRLVATIGWHPLTRAITFLGLLAVPSMSILTAVQALQPGGAGAREALTDLAAGLAGVCGWAALPVFASRLGVGDGEYLRSWVAAALHASAAAVSRQ